MKDLTPLEAGRWLSAAPPAVQEVVTGPATAQTIAQIGKQYELHIDTVGLLLKLTSYMLIGYARPEEALQELRGANLSDQQARQIMAEINQKLFIPLRQKMQKAASAPVSTPAPVQTPPAKPVPPRPAVVMPRVGPPPPPAAGESHFHLQNKLPPPLPPVPPTPTAPLSKSVPPVPPASSFKPPASRFAPLPPKLGAPVRESQTFTESRKLLADHEEPHIDISDKVRVVSRPPAEPPPNLPGALPPQPIPVPPTPASPQATHAPSETPQGTAPPPKPIPPAPKSYSVDPYREPIDEK